MSIAKTTPLYKDRATLELRFEAFNLFNHTQFSNFDTSAADLGFTFGQATQAMRAGVAIGSACSLLTALNGKIGPASFDGYIIQTADIP